MSNIKPFLQELLSKQNLIRLRLFGPREQRAELPNRIEARPLLLRGKHLYQFAFYQGNRVVHRNLDADESLELLAELFPDFKQAEVFTAEADYHIILDRKQQATIHKRPPSQKPPSDLRHDRKKTHLLPEGTPNDFLARLGVMTAEGKVIAAKADKFKQINRFLEMVGDVAGELDTNRPIQVVDFGCGKSYLTFALYHYLRNVRGLDAQILGLDLKEDVITECRQIAADLNYNHLEFRVGDIRGCEVIKKADMVVSLHACDTATDDALVKAIQWETKVILAVPCCQKELFRQIRSEMLQPMLKHGIIRERLAALVTDTARAQLLETVGYSVQMLEFIEMEHTPKNLLIRAVRRPNAKHQAAARADYEQFRDFWQIHPHMEKELRASTSTDKSSA
jgi:hypothetical protein